MTNIAAELGRATRAGLLALILGCAVAPATGLDGVTGKEKVLPNGLRVVVSELKDSRMVSVAVAYRIGSAHEPPEAPGAAHLLEHMMFNGSSAAGKHIFQSQIGALGGTVNAATGFASTVYFETAPKQFLERIIDLEADRMCHLRLDGADLEQEKRVAGQEYRASIEQRAFGHSMEEALRLASTGFAFGHLPLASSTAMTPMKVAAVRSLYQDAYTPDRCTIAVVGDVNARRVIEYVRQRFAKIEKRSNVTEPPVPQVSAAAAPVIVRDRLAANRRIDLLFRVPSGSGQEAALLEAMRDLLNIRVRTSETAAIRSARASLIDHGATSIFWVAANLDPSTSADSIRQAVVREIGALKTGPVTREERDALRRTVTREMAELSEQPLRRAVLIAKQYAAGRSLQAINEAAYRRAQVEPSELRPLVDQLLAAQPVLLVTEPAPRATSAAR